MTNILLNFNLINLKAQTMKKQKAENPLDSLMSMVVSLEEEEEKNQEILEVLVMMVLFFM